MTGCYSGFPTWKWASSCALLAQWEVWRVGDVALVYVRRSMVRYDEDRASPERQLANCVAVCEQKGWAYEVYEDAQWHRSGRSEKHRPG